MRQIDLLEQKCQDIFLQESEELVKPTEDKYNAYFVLLFHLEKDEIIINFIYVSVYNNKQFQNKKEL